MSRIDTVVCTDARKTKYRFVVLTMIFLVGDAANLLI